MRLAVSNIAWTAGEAEAAYATLCERNVRGLEFAPSLVFGCDGDPLRPGPSQIREFVAHVRAYELEPVALQSIFFGVRDASLFGSVEERRTYQSVLQKAVDLAADVGAPVIVLGAPTLRQVPESMIAEDAERIASDMLGSVERHAATRGVRIALEPNPVEYGTNFLNSLKETRAFVSRLGMASVKLNLDLGALVLNRELDDAGENAEALAHEAAHVHLSLPHLRAITMEDRYPVARALRLFEFGYVGWASIEMRSGTGDNIARVRSAIDTALAGGGCP